MAQRATNTPTVSQELTWTEVDEAMMAIPEPLRRWMQYEASSPFNPVQIVEVHRTKPWSEIWSDLLKMSRNDHCDHFGSYSLRHNDAEFRAQIERMRYTQPKIRHTVEDWFSSKAF